MKKSSKISTFLSLAINPKPHYLVVIARKISA